MAIAHLEDALAFKGNLDGLTEANTLDKLGDVALSRADLSRAADYYLRAKRHRERVEPNGPGLVLSLRRLGDLATADGRNEEAVQLLERALVRQLQLGPRSMEVSRILGHLGALYRSAGDLDGARRLYRQGHELLTIVAPESLHEAWMLKELGIVARLRGGHLEATTLLSKALAILEQTVVPPWDEAEILYELALIDAKRGQLEDAAAVLLRALDSLDTCMRLAGGSYRNRALLRHRHRNYYSKTIEVLIEIGQPETAFHVLERLRARTLLELMTERDFAPSSLPPALSRARRSLAFRLDKNLREISRLSYLEHKARIETLRDQRRALLWEHEDLAQGIRASSPELALLQYPEPVNLTEIQENLDPGTVVLSYGVFGEYTTLFILDAQGELKLVVLDLGEAELQLKIEEYRSLINRARRGATLETLWQLKLREVGSELFNLLVKPAASEIESGDRVLILADGPLHALPFGALIRRTGTEPAEQFLMEWKPIYLAPSATLHGERLRNRLPPVESPQLVAFGDPATGTVGGQEQERAIADPYLRSALERSAFEWSPLPHAREEVRRIAELFENASTHVGSEATEERATTLDKRVRIVHFATHGYLDDRFPLDSAVVLSLADDLPSPRPNGLLQAWEIFERVRLEADLVVLSACESALATQEGGEGLLGLTQAFQYAGARSVLASLWRVQDDSTAELMVRFYRNLRAGNSKAEALRAAQLELIRGAVSVQSDSGASSPRDFSAPYYWAAFQLYGDWL